jgi:hypothetical protein
MASFIEVEGPGGIVVEFPQGTDPTTIDRVMRQAVTQVRQDVPERAPRSIGNELAAGLNDQFQAAGQRTSPNVRKLDGSLNYDPLGELVQMDGGNFYQDAQGELRAINPEHDVILRDPQTNKPMVFARNDEMNEGVISSAARVILPGIPAGAPARLPGGAGAAMRAAPKPAAAAAQRVQAFDRSGVTPSLPAASESNWIGRGANMLKETPVGAPIQRRVAGNLEEAGNRAQQIAGMASDVRQPEVAGRDVGSAARAFMQRNGQPVADPTRTPSRQVGFGPKQETLYDAVERSIDPQAMGRLDETLRAWDETLSQFDDPALAEAMKGNGPLARFAGLLRDAHARGALTFRDMRQLRTQLRYLREGANDAQRIQGADIDRLYSGLSMDMQSLADAHGASQAARRADRFTRAGEQARRPALEKFAPEGASGERVFENIIRAAKEGSGADSKSLAALYRSVPKQEWNKVTSTFIDRMGRAKPGQTTAAGAAEWSPSSFLTEYSKLSKNGKFYLFDAAGNSELRRALDDLLKVSGELKRVEKLGNPSGSGHIAIQGGVAGSLATAASAAVYYGDLSPALALAFAGIGGNGAARLMANPRFVRWLTGAHKVQKAAKSPRDRQRRIAQHAAGLRLIGGDKEMQALTREFMRHLQDMTPATTENGEPRSR